MSALFAALRGRCPACREGALYERFLVLHELCPRCGVRYEREVSTRTIATILSFGVGAGLAFGVSGLVRRLGGAESALIPIGVALGAVIYPLFRSFAVFFLWQNGLVTVDGPPEPRPPPRPPEPYVPPLAFTLSLPRDDDETAQERRPPTDEEHTDERDR